MINQDYIDEIDQCPTTPGCTLVYFDNNVFICSCTKPVFSETFPNLREN